MLPSSHSTQNLHSVNNLGLPLPPRSSSSINLSGAANDGRQGGSFPSGSSAPSFFRAPSSTVNASSTSLASYAPASPRLASASHTPTYTPSLAPSLANHHHHSNYDSRLVANTINRIESTSGIGAAGNSVGGSGTASAGAIAAASSEGKGSDSDAWTAACIRTLPLFNGEGQRGYIEDLNDLVALHVKRSIERIGANSSVVASLTSDLVDLLAMGMLTLNAKLSDLNDEKLLIRITEVWNFFFIGCLPYVEGIFLPLRTEPAVRQIVGRGQNSRPTEAIDIRSLALRSFRDHLVLPIVDRLAVLFSSEASPTSTQPVEPSSRPHSTSNISSTARTASARRLQMVSILASLQTNDDRQSATEALAKALRAGLERRPSFAALDGTGMNGLYGTGYYKSSAAHGRGASDAERKAWRRVRQIRPGPQTHPGPNRSDDSRRDGDSTLDAEEFAQMKHNNRIAEDERRYFDQLRSPDLYG